MTFETFSEYISRQPRESVLSQPAQELILSIRGQKRAVGVERIVYLEGDGNYTNIVLRDGSRVLVARTLRDYELMLDSRLFVRIHKSCMVNLQFVISIDLGKDAALELTNGQLMRISRRRVQEFRERMAQPAE